MKIRSKRVSTYEKRSILIRETNKFILFLLGLVSSSLLSWLLYLGLKLSFLRDSVYLLPFVVFGAMGIAATFFIIIEYKLKDIAFKKGEVFNSFLYLNNYFFFFTVTILLVIFVLPPWNQVAKNIPYRTKVLTIVVFSLVLSWAIKGVWEAMFFLLLSLVSNVDYELIIDREHFDRVIKIRFAETRIYPAPLSLMLVAISGFEDLQKKYGRRLVRLQDKIMDFISSHIRELDMVGRYGEGKFVAALLHTAGADAKVPAERLSELSQKMEIEFEKGKIKPRFAFGIATYKPTMQTEQELVSLAEKALEEALNNPDKNIVIY